MTGSRRAEVLRVDGLGYVTYAANRARRARAVRMDRGRVFPLSALQFVCNCLFID
jgi:hypothetical protein